MSHPSILDRLDALESRIAAVEDHLHLESTPPAMPAEPIATAGSPLWPVPDKPFVTARNSSGPSLPQPAPSPAIAPRTTTPNGAEADPQRRSAAKKHAADRARDAAELERMVGMTIVGRLGIAAIVLAAGYFGQLGWGHLGAGGKLALLYAVAAALLSLGAWLRPRVSVGYTALLWGGGVAVSYVAGAFGHLGYQLLGPTTALLAMLASTALGQWLAHILRLQVLATVALAGAFAAPFLVNADATTPTGLFVLAIMLHGWSAWVEHRWQWHWARLIGVAGAALHATAWYVTHPHLYGWSDIAHLDVLLVAVTLPELLRAWHERRLDAGRQLAVAAAWTVVQVVLLLNTGLNAACHTFGALTAAGLLGLGIAYERRAAGLGTWASRLGSVLLPIGALVWTHQEWATAEPLNLRWIDAAALTASTGLLLAVRRWAHAVELGTTLGAAIAASLLFVVKADHAEARLLIAGIAVPSLLLVAFGRSIAGPALGQAMAVAVVTFGWWPDGGFHGAAPGWTSLALVGGMAVAVFGVLCEAKHRNPALRYTAIAATLALSVGWIMTTLADTRPAAASGMTPFFNHRFLAMLIVGAGVLWTRARAARDDLQLNILLAVTALAIAYVGGLVELLDAIAGLADGWRAITISLYTLAYALGLLVYGFRANLSMVRWAGLWGMLFVAGKVVIYDLASVDTPLRVLAAGGLGAVMLGAAWLYARTKPPTTAANDDGDLRAE